MSGSRPQRGVPPSPIGSPQHAPGHKPSHDPKDLLDRLRRISPDLQAEDAFVVPRWFSQQITWLQDPQHSDNHVYNFPLLLCLRGPLNESALRRGLQEIVQRHGVLRSVFRILDGELVQIVLPAPDVSLPFAELSSLAGAARDARVHELTLEEASRPFDLSRDPLLRGQLLRLAPEEHILQLTTHHLVYDDWSTGILIRELSKWYEAFATGATPTEPMPSYQYGDFVRWQEERFQGSALESELAYWKQQLASPTGFQHLPTDHARPSTPSHRGARETMALPVDLANTLVSTSRKERVSLFMVLLAGFQCLQHRYSKEEDIGIASCGANRPLTEVEGLVGRFGNDMVLRTSLAGNPTFRELLKRVREVALSAYSHQDLPFGMLAGGRPNGAEAHHPPFQTMFILQNAPKEAWQLPGLTASWMPLQTGTAKHDLIVWLKSEPTLEVSLEYSTDLFDRPTMKRVLEDYRSILEAMARDPGALVADIPIAPAPNPTRTQAPAAIANAVADSVDRNRVEPQLVELWEAAFGFRPIGVNQNFFELGGDSLLAARLFTQIEKTFKTKLPLATLVESPTIAQLAQILSVPSARPSTSCLVAVQPKGTRPPLFCVHGHAGEIFYCWNLSRCLGMDQPLYGLRARGLSEESAYYTVEEMATHYLAGIRSVQPRGPYYLSGYCFGGMVAYDMARQLIAEGESVAMLVLFNTPSPGSLEGWPLRQAYLTRRITHELKKLGELRMREKLEVLGAKAAGLGRLALGSAKEAIWKISASSPLGGAGKWTRRLLNVPDINIAAAKAYAPGPYPGRAILFLTAEASSLYTIGPRAGWTPLINGGIEVYDAEGDNISMFDAQYVATLAERLKSCLDRVHGT
ncbi:MAG TPA: condensation domain-containing protein [Verrucomicrobiae bacterium]|nr:condensation domain-containing protein [Verrucomicrobiae bacterium]